MNILSMLSFFFLTCCLLKLILSKFKFRLLILLVVFHFEIYLFFIHSLTLVCRFILSSKISLFSLSFFLDFFSSSMFTYHYLVTTELPTPTFSPQHPQFLWWYFKTSSLSFHWRSHWSIWWAREWLDFVPDCQKRPYPPLP